MSKPVDVWNGVLATLWNDTTLKGYVKQVLEGQRELETITLYPTIIADYAGCKEVEDTYSRQRITMTVSLNVVIQVLNKDKQIAGDTNTKGVLDIINDIKKAFDADRTLGGVAIHTTLPDDALTTVNFPVRVIVLTIDVLFEQDKTVRT